MAVQSSLIDFFSYSIDTIITCYHISMMKSIRFDFSSVVENKVYWFIFQQVYSPIYPVL